MTDEEKTAAQQEAFIANSRKQIDEQRARVAALLALLVENGTIDEEDVRQIDDEAAVIAFHLRRGARER